MHNIFHPRPTKWLLATACPYCRPTCRFCPGPRMGLYQFTRMPFGLYGAASSFQKTHGKVMRGLSFVTTYQDDIRIHSKNEKSHQCHLQEVFERLTQAGLTLCGRKCCIGMPNVLYLVHVFSATRMSPDPHKIEAILDWPKPTSAITSRQFLGLASYYQRYIQNFACIGAPLHTLTWKTTPFLWSHECEKAFTTLKSCLTQPCSSLSMFFQWLSSSSYTLVPAVLVWE